MIVIKLWSMNYDMEIHGEHSGLTKNTGDKLACMHIYIYMIKRPSGTTLLLPSVFLSFSLVNLIN